MDRKEMLEYLNQISFNVLWPHDSWKDLGFTESPIWINNKGYGYYACDEPNIFYQVSRIPDDQWKQIKQKQAEGILSKDDFMDTSFENTYLCLKLSKIETKSSAAAAFEVSTISVVAKSSVFGW